MGVIFTLQGLLDGRIPSLEDYISAKRLCGDKFQELHKGGFIDGVLFYGSFSNDNDFRIGSDIDFILIVNSLQRDFVERLQEFTKEIHGKNVPLEYNALTIEQVKQNRHGIEPCFLEQIKYFFDEEIVI